MAPKIKISPSQVALEDEFLLTGSGYDGDFVRISVNYENRAELYKAAVAQDQVSNPEWTRGSGLPEMIPNPKFKAGDISVTIRGEQVGRASITVWDWAQRKELAHESVEVIDGG